MKLTLAVTAAAALIVSPLAFAAADSIGGADIDSAADWTLVASFAAGDSITDAPLESGMSLGDCFEAASAPRMYVDNVRGRQVSVSYSCERL